ncbi:MAG: DEAD/DEAH box helicase family protein [Atribacterota bacterium]
MVNITLKDNLYLKIKTDLSDYLIAVKEHFTAMVPGRHFMESFRSGSWDGKVCFFNSLKKELPYGLFIDLLKFHKENYKDLQINISKDVYNLFKPKKFKLNYNLKFKPHDYQKECIEAAFTYSKGLIKSPTASGKSLIISYIIDNLKNINRQQLVIVPTVDLVEQFYSDMKEYGIKCVGRVHANLKEYDKPITISTWQSMVRNHELLDNYQTIIVDEAHSIKGIELRNLLEKARKTSWRFGLTGTLPSDKIDIFNVKSFVGPIIKSIDIRRLIDEGYIAGCNIKMVYIDNHIEFNGNYNEVKEHVFNQPYRLELITNIIKDLGKENVLLLVGLVEKEGEILERYLKDKLPKKKVVFLSGRDKIKVREKWRNEFKDNDDIVMIATYGIYQTGINIPPLKYLIFASPFKSEIRVLQSIGRALRKHASKKEGAYIFDIIDDAPYIDKHAKKRYDYYDREEFDIECIDVKPGEKICY